MKVVAFIVPTHNRRRLLSKLVSQIIQQDYNKDLFKVHIVIVVDGSTDGTIEMLNEFNGDITIVEGDGSWWWTRCINEGIVKSIELGADYFLLLNDDNEIRPDYLATLLKDYSSLPENSILGSASVSIEKSQVIDSAGTRSFNRILCRHKRYYEKNSIIDESFKGVHPAVCFSGRGTLIPNKIITYIGVLDIMMVQYGSDEDFILRASRMGVPTYISWNACIFNYTSMTSYGKRLENIPLNLFLLSFFDRYTNNNLFLAYYFYKKNCNKFLAFPYATMHFTLSLLLYLKKRLIHVLSFF